MSPESWLPPLVLFDGNWQRYLVLLYSKYEIDFVSSTPCYKGTYLRIKRLPREGGRDATFWHLIQKGVERNPDIRRCERICWPKPIVEHCEESCIKIWENTRKGAKRICIWYELSKYIVILEKRTNYILFWTSYPIEKDHTERKLRKEYERYIAGVASNDDSATPSARGR